ncbi:FAD-dependent oxidoreductase [Flavobacteriaceae bacterium R38]|nr:FAD-dependent oxidoreductase [Flavobacteriaceae bacterium R38]
MKKSEVIIIGAGLTGLTTAYFLKQRGISAIILEASPRIGGRIDTYVGETGVTMEMGATWFGLKHKSLVDLLAELNVDYFPQHTKGISLFETMSFVPPQRFEVPESEEPSYRIKGGTETLIKRLGEKVGSESIILDTKVERIGEEKDELVVSCSGNKTFSAKKVITTLPPNLLVNTIQFTPDLPKNFKSLCTKTHTWMSESIKFAVEYKTAFWKENNYSGTLFSQSGIIQEQYDHSSIDSSCFALKGFLNGGTITLSREEREAKVKAQLVHLFGEAAGNYVSYNEKVWNNEGLTHAPYNGFVMPHQNNGHELYQKTYMNDALYVSGTETAVEFPGYMDGAVKAAKTIAEKITNEKITL